MKPKTINKIISKKVSKWIGTITDEVLRKELTENFIVSGGCIASMLLNEEVNDFDIYFSTKEIAQKVAEYYIKKFNDDRTEDKKLEITIYPDTWEEGISLSIKSKGVASATEEAENYQYFEGQIDPNKNIEYIEKVNEAIDNSNTQSKVKEDYHPIYFTSNAITLSDGIQLIMRFTGTNEEIHSNFDFVHCTNYFDSKENKLVLNQKALECILSKELIYVGSKYPLTSIIRTRKFINRGWTINAGQYLKIMYQISKLNLDDMQVLQEQLIGVDVAYFHELINIMKEDKENGRTIDYSYLANLVDTLF